MTGMHYISDLSAYIVEIGRQKDQPTESQYGHLRVKQLSRVPNCEGPAERKFIKMPLIASAVGGMHAAAQLHKLHKKVRQLVLFEKTKITFEAREAYSMTQSRKKLGI